MTISKEENQKYFDFVEEQVKSLKALDVSPNEILWHYTTGNGLLSIVASGSLYATQVSCLNDSTEVLYSTKLLTNAFLKIRPEKFEERYLLERMINPVEEPVARINLTGAWFVTCFSKERDDLSQWRAYGGGENGYAIAFHAGGLFGRANGILARVNYNQKEHEEVAARVANATLEFFKEGLYARFSGQADHRLDEINTAWMDEFLHAWEPLVSQLAPMVKDPAFRSENEYRIVHNLQVDELSQLQFRQKQTLMSRHLPLVFPPINHPTPSQKLPIVEVMVGPSRHKEISRISVDALLRQKGYAVPVTISAIPFQTT
jgi:hypothetical protein